jgi:acyl transferase domain-containing protein
MAAFPPVRRVPGSPRPRPPSARDGDVAVVGLGCVLPGASSVAAFWRALVDGRSAVGLVPPERWSLDRYLDPAATEGSRPYARHAAAVRGFTFDPLPFRLPPRVVATMDPAQRMALVAAAQAVRDAGWDQPPTSARPFDRARAAVVLGNSMGGEFAKSMALRVRFRDVLDEVARDELAAGWTTADVRALEDRVERALAPRLPPIEVDSMAGLLSNVVAGRVAAWLDWMGGNLTVDAACAASLASVSVAVDWLRAGRVDAVLAGGVDADLSAETFVGFCRTEALSRTGSRPFSTLADGFVMGEGAAVLALMRHTDAVRQGRRVLAVVRSVGQSSDGRGRGITAPRAEGQDLAIDRAWREAGVEADEFGLVEAHGTGTAVGDATELGVLSQRFGGVAGPVWLGSVKSNVGHLKGGAGAVSLLKATLALCSGVVPPTLLAGPVQPGLAEGPLRLPALAAPLGRPLAAVSGFGFGGTNYHVVLARGDASDPLPDVSRSVVVGAAPGLERAWGAGEVAPVLTAWGATSEEALRSGVAAGSPMAPAEVAALPHRVVALHAPGEDPRPRVLRALDGGTDPAVRRGHGAPLPVHLVFPGQGAQGKADEAVTRRMPAALAVWGPLQARAEAELGRGWAALVADAGRGEVVAVHAVGFVVGVAHAAALQAAGTPIASVAGHSLGAFPAAVAAGAWSAETAWPLVITRARALASCPEGGLVAVRGALDAAPPGLTMAAVNGDDQQVWGGAPADVAALAAALGPTRARVLPVTRAYHGPLVAAAGRALESALRGHPPEEASIPTWSSRTGQRVDDPDDLADDLAAAVAEPVRFDLVLAALAAAPGLVVDVGPGGTLAALARASGLQATALDGPRGPAEVAAALLAAGHPGLALALPATAVELALAASPPAREVPLAPAERPEVRIGEPPPAEDAAEPPPALPDDDVRAAVIEIVARITGYPPDWITEGAELEADLGVDSIRKLQVLGALEQRFGFTTAEGDVAALQAADLGSLVAHVRANAGRRRSTPLEEPAPGLVFAVPAVVPRPPPHADDDVLGALARITATARASAGPLAPTLRTDPAGLAAAAWLRSFSRETGRAVDHGGPPDEALLPLVPGPDRPLPRGLVVLATGGLRGLLRPCLLALAELEPRVVVLHRSDVGGELPFPTVLVRGDVTVRADVERAVAAALASFGRLDLVVHAAGALRDGPWDAATDADRAAVVGPKWDGARHLAAATATLPLSAFVTCSSLVAHVGNAGQTTYAAANAAMETVRHPLAPTLHLAWTAWEGVGMAADPALGRLLRSRGVVPLAPDAGAAAFRALVGSGATGPVLVAAQPLPATRALPWPLGALRARDAVQTSFHLPLDPAEPWLADHRVTGRPLVPAACWVGAVLAAGAAALGGTWAAEAVEVLVPTFVDAPRSDVAVTVSHGEGPVVAEITARGATVARARLHAARGPGERGASGPVATEDAGLLYHPGLLFHGPSWRWLRRWGSDGDHFSAELSAPGGGHGGVAGPVDAVHQLLAAVGDRRHGWLGLPVGAARWEAWGGVVVRVEGVAVARGRELVADVIGLDAADRVVLAGQGVRLRAARGDVGAADA